MNRIANSADATISHYIKSASEDRALRKCPVDIFSKVPGSVAGRVAMGIYKEHRGTDDTLQLVEHAIYGSSRLGLNTTIVDLSDGAEDNDPVVALDYGTRQYELSDHLGNVSVVLSGIRLPNTGNTNFTADVLSANEYYPFGMVMPNRTFSSESYRYGFNGMEKDEEFTNSTSHYDFGARIYDGRIGRWLALDPLMERYPNTSPYVFAANNPIILIDPDGRAYKKGEVAALFKNDEDLLLAAITELDAPHLSEIKDNVQTYSFTIHSNQPQGAESGDIWTGDFYDPDTGHSFVTLTRKSQITIKYSEWITDEFGNKVQVTREKTTTIEEKVTFGFRPLNHEDAGLWNTVPGAVTLDDVKDADVSATKEISMNDFEKVLEYTDEIIEKKQTYSLDDYNCTDFAIGCAESAGMKVPKNKDNYAWGSINSVTPARLGEDLNKMTKEQKKEREITVTKNNDPSQESNSSTDEGRSSED